MSDITAQIDELVRERGKRAGLYPRWVEAKKITQHQADTAMGALDAAIETLVGVRATGQISDAKFTAHEAPQEIAVKVGSNVYRYERKA